MSNIPAISGAVPLPPVESEVGLGEGDKHCEFGDENEEMPQGVLSLLQQLIPQKLPLISPRLSLSGGRHDAVGPDPAPRLPEGRQSARRTEQLESRERSEPRGVSLSIEMITRNLIVATPVHVGKQLEVTQVAERVTSEQRPTLGAGPDTRLAGGEQQRATTSERVDKASQSQVILGNPLPGPVTRHDLSSGTEKAASLLTRLPMPPADLADKTVEAYLRLPFAKDGAVGFVNVSKPAGDMPAQLNLTASNSDISRHLAQHLHSAEPAWRLTDSRDSAEQQGRDSNDHTDEDPDEPVVQSKHQEGKG